MNGGKRPLGYTIIEVMIVLAVSGVMFLIAAQFISGKQESTAFTEGVNQMASQVQTVIEQVTDGQYQDIPLSCSFTSGVTTVGGGTKAQGTDASCEFLGKFLRFTPGTANYSVESLAGGRLTTDVTPTLSTIDPQVITQITTQETVPQNLTVKSVTIVSSDGSTSPIKPNFGFVQGLGTANGAEGGFESGSQTLSLISTSVDADGSVDGSNVFDAASAVVCISDGARFATISVGGTGSNGNQLAVNTQLGLSSCP